MEGDIEGHRSNDQGLTTSAMNVGLLLGGVGIGALPMYFFDPGRGHRLRPSGYAKLLLTFYTRKIIFFLQNIYMRKDMAGKKTDLLQATLDLLVLKPLAPGPLHGLGASHRIRQTSKGASQLKPGSLFPAPHRTEEAGWPRSFWGESQNNRGAKYYRLTTAGGRRPEAGTEDWLRISPAIAGALRAA